MPRALLKVRAELSTMRLAIEGFSARDRSCHGFLYRVDNHTNDPLHTFGLSDPRKGRWNAKMIYHIPHLSGSLLHWT